MARPRLQNAAWISRGTVSPVTRLLLRVNAEAAKAHCDKYGTKHWTSDQAELLARDDVEAVVICTPTGYHRDAVIAAAAAGKHIFCEKPMAMNVADCDAMERTCTGAGVVLQIGFVRHFCNEWLKLREIIQSGQIGRPVVWRSVSGGSGAPTPWFFDKEIGGGPFIDGAVPKTTYCLPVCAAVYLQRSLIVPEPTATSASAYSVAALIFFTVSTSACGLPGRDTSVTLPIDFIARTTLSPRAAYVFESLTTANL